MREGIRLALRLMLWGVCFAVLVVWSWYFVEWLQSEADPLRGWARKAIHAKCPALTGDERRLVNAAIAKDPIAAVLVVHDEHARGRAPWDALRAMSTRAPSREVRILRRAVDAVREKHLDEGAATAFVDSAATMSAVLAELGEDADQFVDGLAALSPQEYRAVGVDISYAIIAPRLDPQHRSLLRDNLDFLTPILAACEADEWNALMKLFADAQPRAGQIFRDENMGQTYGLVYMLNRVEVEKLKSAGIEERLAIEFAGANAATVKNWPANKRDWVEIAREMAAISVEQDLRAPDATQPELVRKTMFEWACADPAILALVSRDEEPGGGTPWRCSGAMRAQAFRRWC